MDMLEVGNIRAKALRMPVYPATEASPHETPLEIQQPESATKFDAQSKFDAQKLARGLGWASLALGVAELVAPKAMARVFGLQPQNTVFRLCGLREISNGGIILSRGGQPALGIWGRLAGGVLNLTFLNAGAVCPLSNMTRVKVGAASLVGMMVLDLICARELSRASSLHVKPG